MPLRLLLCCRSCPSVDRVYQHGVVCDDDIEGYLGQIKVSPAFRPARHTEL